VDVVIPPRERMDASGSKRGASPYPTPQDQEAVASIQQWSRRRMQDEGVAEFCRFDLDRRKQETPSGQERPRATRKKIEGRL